MRKDIEIPIAKEVYVAIVQEWNKEFLAKDYNAYIINNRDTVIETVLVVSKGYNKEVKTSTMRHGIGNMQPKSFTKIELLTDDVLQLDNEFYVTFFADNKLYEKKFFFPKNSVSEKNTVQLPVMEVEGVLAQ